MDCESEIKIYYYYYMLLSSATLTSPGTCIPIYVKLYYDMFKEHTEDKTTSLLVQMYNRIQILVMLQIKWLNISYQLFVITKISAIISRYLTAKFEQ